MKRNWKQLLFMLVLGLFLGMALGRLSGRFFHPFDGPPEKRHERMMKHFVKALELDPEQAERVKAIFTEKRKQIDGFHAEVRPKMKAMKDSALDEIREILSAEQKEKLTAFEVKHEKRWRKRGKHSWRHHW